MHDACLEQAHLRQAAGPAACEAQTVLLICVTLSSNYVLSGQATRSILHYHHTTRFELQLCGMLDSWRPRLRWHLPRRVVRTMIELGES